MEEKTKKTTQRTPKKVTKTQESAKKAKEPLAVEQEEFVVEKTRAEVNNNPVKTSGRLSQKKNKSLTINIEDKNREVPVLSVVSFGVGYQCKEKNMFLKWNNYGDEHTMTIQEVLNMNGESRMFLYDPCLLVDDEEVAMALGLTEMYDLIFEIENLEEFYSQGLRQIETKLDKLPNEMRKNLLARTITMIAQGELSNLEIVRLLKNKYEIEIEI